MPLRQKLHVVPIPQSLPPLPDYDRISPRCIRINGANPGKFTLQGTNTYLLGTGHQRILVDSGDGQEKWAQTLKTVLDQEGAVVKDLLITHWHHDHCGGNHDVRKLCPDVKVWRCAPGSGEKYIPDGHVFKVPGATLKAYQTPGHACDHVVFLVEEDDALITGDNVLGHGTSYFENLTQYMESLKRMRTLFKGRAYPGHGEIAQDGPGLIDKYLLHRKQREDEIVRRLKNGTREFWTEREMVQDIYIGITPELSRPAMQNVRHILLKLAHEDKVSMTVAPGGDIWKWKS